MQLGELGGDERLERVERLPLPRTVGEPDAQLPLSLPEPGDGLLIGPEVALLAREEVAPLSGLGVLHQREKRVQPLDVDERRLGTARGLDECQRAVHGDSRGDDDESESDPEDTDRPPRAGACRRRLRRFHPGSPSQRALTGRPGWTMVVQVRPPSRETRMSASAVADSAPSAASARLRQKGRRGSMARALISSSARRLVRRGGRHHEGVSSTSRAWRVSPSRVNRFRRKAVPGSTMPSARARSSRA